VSHLVDDAIVHGAELVQNAGHGPFRRFVVKVRVQQIRSLQRGGATQTLTSTQISVVDTDPNGSALVLFGWIRIQECKIKPENQKRVRKFHVLKL
jgi:hypothetical protein